MQCRLPLGQRSAAASQSAVLSRGNSVTIRVVKSLPFPGFRWRWASVQPTEGLNRPSVFLGALRAFSSHEGEAPSSAKLAETLKAVEREAAAGLVLSRTAERNLLRNSGQYWKGLGLMEPKRGEISLTPFGRKVAIGEITPAEFATAVVVGLELPNVIVQSGEEIEKWTKSAISIRPLDLLIRIMEALGRFDGEEAYLTREELIRIIEPLSGVGGGVPPEDYADTVLAHRKRALDISSWPNCAPGANDARMAREFLLFLSYYGFCRQSGVGEHERFHLDWSADVSDLVPSVATPGGDIFGAARNAMVQAAAGNRERRRVLKEVLERPGQKKFRSDVLNCGGNSCLLTGASIKAALEAAHLIPVKDGGLDSPGNGVCLRSDIHSLFDSGHIRINRNGDLSYSELARTDPVYKFLPGKVTLPSYLDLECVVWRWKYC